MALKATTLNNLCLITLTVMHFWSLNPRDKEHSGILIRSYVLEIDLENMKITGYIQTGNEPDQMVFFRSDN
jgi:hypothetical protein